MLVLKLDSWFKNLQLIHDFVGLDLAMQVAAEYDHEIFILLLLIIYNNLTPTSMNVEHVGSITLEFGVFRGLASIEQAILGLLKN
jgi:hypothetical protein